MGAGRALNNESPSAAFIGISLACVIISQVHFTVGPVFWPSVDSFKPIMHVLRTGTCVLDISCWRMAWSNECVCISRNRYVVAFFESGGVYLFYASNAGVQWIVFLPSAWFHSEKFFDITGSFTYAFLAVFRPCARTFHGRQILVTVFVLIWSARLGSDCNP